MLLPAAAPGWGFSVSYFWQWKEGQSKVIETLLLTVSFYLGMKGRPVWSGVILGIAFFDPRFALAAIPLFLTYNAAKASCSQDSIRHSHAVKSRITLPRTGNLVSSNDLQHWNYDHTLSLRYHSFSGGGVSDLRQLLRSQQRAIKKSQVCSVSNSSAGVTTSAIR